MLRNTKPFYEIAITGPDFKQKFNELSAYYVPNKLVLGAKNKSILPLLEGRFTQETMLYVCENKSCQLPVKTIKEALKQIKY
jgi:uncharacterized protein YyaL (SSP411 family)